MAELTGEQLKERARELNIEGRSEMNADQLRSAIADAEGGGDTGGTAAPVATEDERADTVREALGSNEYEDVDAPVSASPEQNAELEHTAGGVTTRDDPTDQGVPMLQGEASEPVGPEDALGVGPKRGEYDTRVMASINAHEVERIDGGTGESGPVVTNDDGGIETLPHSRAVPQVGRVSDRGDAEGEKGGVDTDPRS
jgi:hypothetical protein